MSYAFNPFTGTFDVVGLTSTGADSIYARLDGTNQPFTGNISVSNFSPTISISSLSGESWSIIAQGGAVTQTFSSGIVDPDTLQWTSSLLAFSGTVQGSQLKSTISTGSIPVLVTSTTKCTNLNADKTDGFDLDQGVLTTSSPTHVRLTLSQTTGTSPFAITSTTVNTNLNADLVDGAHVGTSGAAIPLLNAANTWSGVQLFLDQDLTIRNAANTFTVTLVSAATANRTVTLPNATTTLAGTSQTISWTSGNATWTSSASSVLTITNTSVPLSFSIGMTSGIFTLKDVTNGKTLLSVDPVGEGADYLTFNTDGSVSFQTNGVNSINFQQSTFFYSDTSGASNVSYEFGTNGTFNFRFGVTQEIAYTSGNTTFKDGYTIKSGTSTGLKILDSTSQKLGFWNATPVVRPSAYTKTNVTTDRSYDANSTTLDEIADVLGTLIGDLQSVGLLG